MSKTIEVMSGMGAIGITYHSCPWWNRADGRGTLHIYLWFVKIMLRISPFKDITPKGHGSATSDYGIFWWPKLDCRPRIFWQTLR